MVNIDTGINCPTWVDRLEQDRCVDCNTELGYINDEAICPRCVLEAERDEARAEVEKSNARVKKLEDPFDDKNPIYDMPEKESMSWLLETFVGEEETCQSRKHAHRVWDALTELENYRKHEGKQHE